MNNTLLGLKKKKVMGDGWTWTRAACEERQDGCHCGPKSASCFEEGCGRGPADEKRRKEELLITLNMVRCTMNVVDEEQGYREPLHNEDVGTECQRTTTPDEYSYYLLSGLAFQPTGICRAVGTYSDVGANHLPNYFEPLSGVVGPGGFCRRVCKSRLKIINFRCNQRTCRHLNPNPLKVLVEAAVVKASQ